MSAVGHADAAWQARWRAVLDKLDLIATEPELEQRLLAPLGQPQRPTTLAFVNAHAMNSIVADEGFAQALLRADHLLRDGSGMKTLLAWSGRDAGLNLNGTDLIPRLIQRFDGRRIALMGTAEPHLGAAAEHVAAHLAPHSPLATLDGFQLPERYLERAREQQPALIVLGMGMPKQEAVAERLRAGLDHPCVIVCGGAIIDFMGGKVQRAPAWMRAIGMEWAYRLMREPVRLFRRYVIGNPVFLMRARRLARSGP